MLLGWYVFFEKNKIKGGLKLIYFDREESTFLWKRQVRQNKLCIKTTFGKKTNQQRKDMIIKERDNFDVEHVKQDILFRVLS
jgi:hypothetical protein